MTSDQVRRISAGDISAFEEVFRSLHAPLCEVVDRYVHSQALAEEIVQDLFFAVWLKRENLAADSFQAYLFRSARNRALHHVHHESVVRRAAALLPMRPEVAGVGERARSAEDTLVSDEQNERLRSAIRKLPPRSGLALGLRLDHAMTDRAIAEAMGVSIKGVEKLLAIAKRRLRELLVDRRETPPHFEG